MGMDLRLTKEQALVKKCVEDYGKEQERKNVTKDDLIKEVLELKAIEVAKEVAKMKKAENDFKGLKIDCVEKWKRSVRR